MINRLASIRPGIKNIDDLRAHLQIAIELEHSTIPPYLCALYSIPDGMNVQAAQVIRSVVIGGDAPPDSGGQHPQCHRRLPGPQ
ncbi:MAG: hypothetical protein IPG76_09695 [Acidobacteria bacterium]|nr:hypothetical protein [Acidobacteriota bacterium]